MWAQIIKSRMKAESESEMESIRDEMGRRMGERPGLVHSFWMQNQRDQQEYYTLIVFESEEVARQGERALEGDPVFQRILAITEGTPEYVDLNVLEHSDNSRENPT